MKKYILSLSVLAIVFAGCLNQNQGLKQNEAETKTPLKTADEQAETAGQPEIVVDTVESGDTVESPLTVKGKALGSWFFEGTLPVQMENSKGEIIGMAQARALDNWMQEGYVNFEAELPFNLVDETAGTLVIKNDNPSGLPENEKKYEIPVEFSVKEAAAGETVAGDPTDSQLIGGQKDKYGCLTGAGYSWCEPKQKCLRVWEESCIGDPNFNIEEISKAFSKKYPQWDMNKMEITVNKQWGVHAAGSIMETGTEAGGGYWFAAETADGWVIVADGNGQIDCVDIDPYDFPAAMIEECVDENGMPVSRQ